MKNSRRVALALLGLLVFGGRPAAAEVTSLPPEIPLPVPDATGYAPVNGVRLWYASFGRGEPVILVHGALASSVVWGAQVRALAPRYRVIVLDNRGHGRSTWTRESLSYGQLADDVLALMDFLRVEKAAVVGSSDGANVGIDLAIRHGERLTKLFAFAGNADPAGLKDFTPTPRSRLFMQRVATEYKQRSPTPDDFSLIAKADGAMADSQPHFTAEQLNSIRTRTWIVGADNDQFIKRQTTDDLAAHIPGAGELILPGVDHGAPQEDPDFFNAALLHFLALPD